MKVEYDSNNSGGDWWLDDKDWLALSEAGWSVEWYGGRKPKKKDLREGNVTRFLGALASTATRVGLTLGEAIKEWERVTGQLSNALGCDCCGTPHHFTAYDDEGNVVDSYSPYRPDFGDPYC